MRGEARLPPAATRGIMRACGRPSGVRCAIRSVRYPYMTTLAQAVSRLDDRIELALSPASRIHRLREAYWRRTYGAAAVRRRIVGCGEDSLVGHARDFAALLEASEPFIQADELIVGSWLAIADAESTINLGYYNSHYPPGHATLLRLGLAGIRDQARQRLAAEADPARREFLRAVEISYEAACQYVARYAALADALAVEEADPRRRAELERIAAVCRELATGAPTSFQAALQLLQFTRLFGGRGCIGRFDQWMFPFYRADIERGALTQAEAQELLECLFIKLNEFGDAQSCALLSATGEPFASVSNDDLRNIALAGQTPEGEDACNELTTMCLEASAKLMLPEPKLNVRFCRTTPRRLLRECCRVLAKGANVLAFFNDEVVVPALCGVGIPVEDARDYCNDGCSELIIGGKGTIRFWVHDSLPALTETVLEADGHPYATFDELLAAYKARLEPFMPLGPADREAVSFPFFAASIEDCLAEASATGARYNIYGSILAEVGNTADGLAAIKKLVYEDQSVTWEELVAALKADFQGHEPLRQMLLNRAPKYGNDHDEVDGIVKEITEHFCDGVHARACNPPGRGPKWAAGLMCFGIHRKRDLPASP
ncbi:MAG: hypothetical protein FJZ90_17175, partial [Chloroflexi bacterium]|nr:hypothetical protein [Chloroflexota bacterium]